LQVDPLTEKYHAWSPYNYTQNNPLRFVDYNGMEYGDYYTEHGEYLGSDGINDDKAYIANSVTKNQQGNVTTASNSIKLPITNSELLLVSATIYGEAGEKNDDWQEKFAIGNAIANYQEKSGLSLEKTINTISYAASKSSPTFEEFGNSDPLSRNENEGMKTSIAAGINSVMGWKDYSNNATGWDGPDLSTNSHLAGLHYADPNHNIFNLQETKNSMGGWTRETTAAFGETVFHKIHPSWNGRKY